MCELAVKDYPVIAQIEAGILDWRTINASPLENYGVVKWLAGTGRITDAERDEWLTGPAYRIPLHLEVAERAKAVARTGRRHQVVAHLDHSDLVSLIRGSSPHYNLMDELTTLGLGKWTGGIDKWEWTYYSVIACNPNWNKLHVTELWVWYNRIKESWNN